MVRQAARLLLLLLLLSAAAVPVRAEIVERVIARVNGDIVTLSEFETRQVASVQAARIRPEEVETYLRDNNARILQDAVDDLLLQQRAAELGLRLRPEYIAEFVENIKKDNNIESDAALEEALAREGLTLSELKRNIERGVVRRQVLAREVEGKVKVGEDEVRADYEAHAREYEKAPSIQLQEIKVRSVEEAADIAARVSQGEDFAALARARSIAPSAVSGGDLGSVTPGDLAPDISRVAFALQAGQISAPIEGSDGWRLLRVAERQEARRVPLEEVREPIHRRLVDERYTKVYGEYIEGLRKDAIIELRVREVPLQVALPASPSLLEPTAGGGGAASPAAPAASQDDEFAVSPQAKPESVKPPELPGEKDAPPAQGDAKPPGR